MSLPLMTLPDKDHPIWKILQLTISLAGVVYLLSHGAHHYEYGVKTVDSTDIMSAMFGGKVGLEVLRFFARDLWS